MHIISVGVPRNESVLHPLLPQEIDRDKVAI